MKSRMENCEFGKILYLTEGDVTIGITVEMGARISHISAFGSDNLCFYDADFNETSKQANGTIWKQLGGHRLWKTPEDADCYLYDNRSAGITLKTDGCHIVCGQRDDGLQFEMDITMGHNTVTITHIITNLTEENKTCGIWGITALKSQGQAILPLDSSDTGYLPNRHLVLWPYNDVNDKRMELKNDKVIITADNTKPPLKVGTFSKKGEIVFDNGTLTMTAKAVPVEGSYPDYQCNVECYTNYNILEIETLSPIYLFEPSQSRAHTEIWTFERK